MNHSFRLILGLFLLLSLSQCKEPVLPENTTPTRDSNVALGLPDGAKASESSPNAYLILSQRTHFLTTR